MINFGVIFGMGSQIISFGYLKGLYADEIEDCF